MADLNQRMDQARWLFERTLGWISTADVKIGVAMALDTAMIGGLAAAFSSSGPTSRTVWCIRFVLMAATTLLAAIVCLAMAAVPRMKGPSQSLIFFGKIAERNESEFVEEFSTVSAKDLFTDLTRQIHRNAQIAARKHYWVRRSLICSFVSAIPWIASIALLGKK